MSEEQQIVKVVIQKQSVFKIKDFYDFYYDMLKSMGYFVLEDVFSKEGGDTVWEWTCLKWVDDYTQYKVWTKVKVLDAEAVKVKRGGLSEPMDKAKVIVTVKGRIVTDWKDRWGTNPVTKFLKGLYDKYLLGPTMDDRKKELRERVYLIENELKSFFDLPRFM